MPRAIAIALLVGCSGGGSQDDPADGPKDQDTDTPQDTRVVDTGFQGPWVVTEDNGDGTFTTTISALSTVEWVWFSFTDGELAVGAEEPAATWDVAFKREVVHTNGGDSGSGTVAVARLDRAELSEVRWAPVAGFYDDIEADLDGDEEPDWAMYSWFDYDYDTHTLSVADRSWVVRTPNGDVRLKHETYYNLVDGNSGYPRFTWAWLTEAENPLSGDASGLVVDPGAGPVSVSLRGLCAMSPGPTSDAWDIALDGSGATLNSTLTVASVASPFADVTQAPGSGYVDNLDAAFVEGPPGTFTPADLTWVIARPDGTWDKVRFDSTTTLQTEPL